MIPAVVSKLLPRLASEHDGEVVAAARAIDRILKAHGHDWHDIASLVAGPTGLRDAAIETVYQPPPPMGLEADQLMAAEWVWQTASLNEREADFIDGVTHRLKGGRRLSQKQAKWLNDIVEKYTRAQAYGR